MQLQDKTGIICDKCGMTIRDDFTYYSVDFHGCNIVNGIRDNINGLITSPIASSVDICERCEDALAKLVVRNYKPTRKPYCELSGVILNDGLCYYVVLTKVKVSVTNQPHTCVKCHKNTADVDKPCKCGSTKFIRFATTNTVERSLEFFVCAAEYGKFKIGLPSQASEWTTMTQ